MGQPISAVPEEVGMSRSNHGRFDGQVVLVTGAAEGIGLATAELFATERAVAVMADLNSDRLAKSARELTDRDLSVCMFAGDLSLESTVATLFRMVEKDHGKLDVLINLASIYPFSPIDDTTFESWHKVMAANLDTSFLCCREAIRIMKPRRYGRIVNTSSATFHNGQPGLASYVTSKGGVIGLTRVLAWEAGDFGITVNVIMPGLIGTEHVLRMFDDEARTDAFFADALSKQCIKRRGQPLDIAHGIAYLASQEAGFVTGQTLQVGGGFGFST
jgi:NAD(P)-dependent dehydrogenase (short-subunit alcohol dehydrogenase family)